MKGFFVFFTPLTSKFLKSANLSRKDFGKISVWDTKNAEFDADFNSVEKNAKKHAIKVIGENVTEKLRFFYFSYCFESFRPKFFRVRFFVLSSTDSKYAAFY